MRIELEAALARYGEIIDGKWGDEAKWCLLYNVPVEIAQSWINTATGKPTTHIYVNRDLVPYLDRVFKNVIERGLISCLKTFDGCFMIRDVRGELGVASTHSYACALDVNAATNRLGTEGDISRLLVKCFTDAGWAAGADFKRKDPMHFSCAWE